MRCSDIVINVWNVYIIIDLLLLMLMIIVTSHNSDNNYICMNSGFMAICTAPTDIMHGSFHKRK